MSNIEQGIVPKQINEKNEQNMNFDYYFSK